MASLSKDPSGLYTIQICGTDGKRRSIRLGKVNKKTANEIKLKVQYIHAANVSKTALDGDTAAWVAGIGDDLAEKLAAVHLIPRRIKAESVTLLGFIDRFIESKAGARPRSIINYQQAKKKLCDGFGADRAMNSITPVEADQWVLELKKRYATATVARLIKFAKQFYTAAKRVKLVTESPFTDIKAGSMSNPDRIRFVTREEIAKVMDACTNGTWRLIIALARFGGLRCPTELHMLTWGDIDWERSRFLVKSSKTAHHEKGGRRWVPIFPELRPHLEAEFDRAEPGTVHVVKFPQGKETNLRTQFERIIVKAGLLPWTRLFQNLRASRETELCQSHPLHVVTEWIGNSAIIAAKHYLSVTEADFEKAVQNPVQSVSGGRRPELTIIPSGIEKALKVAGCRDVSDSDCTDEYTPQESNL